MTSIISSDLKEDRARRAQDAAARIVADAKTKLGNLEADADADVYGPLLDLSRAGVLDTQEPLLPLLFRLNNQPYSLADYQPFGPMFHTRQPGKSVWITGRQVSKCQCIDTLVFHDDGTPIELGRIKPGDSVTALGRDLRQRGRKVLNVFETGEREVCLVRTRLGAELYVTPEHRLRTLYGYTTVSELKKGTRLAAIRRAGSFFDEPQPADRIVSTAYLLGDDSLLGSSCGPKFTAAGKKAKREFFDIAKRRQRERVSIRRRNNRETGAKTIEFKLAINSELRQWLETDGSWGKYAWEKRFPTWVWRLSRNDSALFLSRLWATAGCVTAAENGSPSISFSSTSRGMAIDVRSMLSKFGIPTSVKRRKAGYKNKKTGEFIQCRDAFIVRIETRNGWKTFFETFDVPDKPPVPIPTTDENNNRDTVPKEIQKTLDHVFRAVRRSKGGGDLLSVGLRAKLKYAPTLAKLREYAEHARRVVAQEAAGIAFLDDLVDGDVIWDEVVEVRPAGRRKTRDIEVEEDHNFIADGVYSHNSTSIAYKTVLDCNSGFLRVLHVAPQFEQIRRFSSGYVKPAIDNATCKHLWVDENCESSVLTKSFRTGSRIIFTFALLDAERTRGISADWLKIDELQSMDQAHLPIIGETLSASNIALWTYTGTALTMDNPIELRWRESSQAEWIVPCFRCNHYNIPSLEFDLEKMLGPARSDVSEAAPGTLCARCGKPVSPRFGFWKHRHGNRVADFQGYHVPQIIMPMHFAIDHKWRELIAKMNSKTAASHVFVNEVLGCSTQSGSQLVSLQDLKDASDLPWDNNPASPAAELMANLHQYPVKILSCDWGGGGDDGVSYTKIALLGWHPYGEVHVLWGKQLLTPHDHPREAAELKHWYDYFNCDLMAHDFTGAGEIRETILYQAGVDADRIWPVKYGRSTTESLMDMKPASALMRRAYYMLDKTRSLLLTCAGIKFRRVRFFRFDDRGQGDPGLISDFLALVDEKVDTPHGAPIYIIRRAGKQSDDFAHAVNIGTCAIWRIMGAWPNFAHELMRSPAYQPIDSETARLSGSSW